MCVYIIHLYRLCIRSSIVIEYVGGAESIPEVGAGEGEGRFLMSEAPRHLPEVTGANPGTFSFLLNTCQQKLLHQTHVSHVLRYRYTIGKNTRLVTDVRVTD